MNKTLACTLLITSCLLTTSCGWHLRGGLNASELESVYVRSAMPHSGFAKLLKNDLGSQGIRLAETGR